jgi:hypothetical protein
MRCAKQGVNSLFKVGVRQDHDMVFRSAERLDAFPAALPRV